MSTWHGGSWTSWRADAGMILAHASSSRVGTSSRPAFTWRTRSPDKALRWSRKGSTHAPDNPTLHLYSGIVVRDDRSEAGRLRRPIAVAHTETRSHGNATRSSRPSLWACAEGRQSHGRRTDPSWPSPFPAARFASARRSRTGARRRHRCRHAVSGACVSWRSRGERQAPGRRAARVRSGDGRRTTVSDRRTWRPPEWPMPSGSSIAPARSRSRCVAIEKHEDPWWDYQAGRTEHADPPMAADGGAGTVIRARRAAIVVGMRRRHRTRAGTAAVSGLASRSSSSTSPSHVAGRRSPG